MHTTAQSWAKVKQLLDKQLFDKLLLMNGASQQQRQSQLTSKHKQQR
jgi:hypothetical protein